MDPHLRRVCPASGPKYANRSVRRASGNARTKYTNTSVRQRNY
jgi:hypothetical protein